MDLETYNNILQRGGGTPRLSRRGSFHGFTDGEIAFKHDLLRGKVVWYNDFHKDWKIYRNMNDEYVSFCKAPKEHPYSRKSRRAVFIANMALSAIFAMMIMEILWVGFGVDPNTRDDDYPNDAKYAKWFLNFVTGFIKMVTGKILKCLVLCPCCYKDSCPNCCRDCWSCLGQLLKCIYITGVLLLFVSCCIMAWNDDFFGLFCLFFFTTNLTGWMWNFFVLQITFRWKWKREKANKNNVLSRYKVTYLQYEEYQKAINPQEDIEDAPAQRTEQLEDKLLEDDGNAGVASSKGRVPTATAGTMEMQMVQSNV